jgi:hypothetical protein
VNLILALGGGWEDSARARMAGQRSVSTLTP